MSDAMLFGVLGMPYDLAMRDELSRLQFYHSARAAAERLEKAERERDALKALLREIRAQFGAGGEQRAPADLGDAWHELGRFFQYWVGSSLYDGTGDEVDLEAPYEAFRALHAALAAAPQGGSE